jgi:hypothetical protein
MPFGRYSSGIPPLRTPARNRFESRIVDGGVHRDMGTSSCGISVKPRGSVRTELTKSAELEVRIHSPPAASPLRTRCHESPRFSTDAADHCARKSSGTKRRKRPPRLAR